MSKTLKVIIKQWSPFFSIKNFQSRKAVVEFSLSFKSFNSRQKVTIRVFFQWPRFIKLSYGDQISWSNIFCQFPLNSLDYNNILIYMKKGVEHISVNSVRATALYKNKWFYIHNVRSNRPKVFVMQLFRTFSGITAEVFMLVMTGFLADFLFDIFKIFNINNSSNLDQ